MPRATEWILIFIVIAWLYTLYKVFTSTFKEKGQKITWALVVFLLGIIGVIIFWIFGKKYVKTSKAIN